MYKLGFFSVPRTQPLIKRYKKLNVVATGPIINNLLGVEAKKDVKRVNTREHLNVVPQSCN